jgi:hypothetical protein
MRHSELVALRRIAGLSEEEIRRIEIAAERHEEHMRPDGAREYVPETAAYALRHYIGRKTMKRLGLTEE